MNAWSSSAFAIRTPVASTGFSGSPSALTRMFVAPPGSTPSAVSVPASALTASLIVPSPENIDDQVDPLVHRLRRELGGVAALLGLGHLEPEVGRERLLDHGQHGLGHRAGHRVHDEQETLEAHRHAGSISGSVGSPIAPRDRRQQGHLLALGERCRGVGAFALHARPNPPWRSRRTARRIGRRAPRRPRRRWPPRPRPRRNPPARGAPRTAERSRVASRRKAIAAASPPVRSVRRDPRRDAHRSFAGGGAPRGADAAARSEDRAPVGRRRSARRWRSAPTRCWWTPPRTPARGTRPPRAPRTRASDPAPGRDRAPGRRALPLGGGRGRGPVPRRPRGRDPSAVRAHRGGGRGPGRRPRSGSGRSRWTPAPIG